MNVDDLLIQHAGTPLEDAPDSVKELLRHKPELQESFAAQADVAALLSLKRYEQPDPALEGRLIHRVGTRIRNAPPPRPALHVRLDNLPGWARLAAAASVMLVLSVLTHKEMLRSESAAENGLPAVARTDPGEPVPIHSITHVDPFTSLVSTQPGIAQDPIGLPPPPALQPQTNNLWNPPPISLPVFFPAPDPGN